MRATLIGEDSGQTSGHDSDRTMYPSRILLVGVLLTACAVRASVLWVWSDNLSDDRDIYLALAEGMAAGRGFSVPGSEVPTAYRPPLYPVLLVVTGTSGSPWGRGVLHLILGLGTVWLTYLLGRRLALGDRLSLFAALLVAVDPLLLRYTTFPMTETLATFLTTALLIAFASAPSLRQQILTGLLFGLCVLCRPTLWAFGGLMLLGGMILRLRSDRVNPEESRGERSSFPGMMIAALLLTVSPWFVRNVLVMGHPILMTTHGGYTLLLGNNPAFYREVVDQPWGTVWDGSVGDGQAKWVISLNRDMEKAGITGEVAQDRWMARRARANILAEPGAFLRACLLRLRRFWSLTPSGSDATALPSALLMPLAIFYGGTFFLAAIGLYRALRSDPMRWLPAMLLLAAFVSVHLVYWSNARMRSPVVPVIALLAAGGLSRRRKRVAKDTGVAKDTLN